MRTIKDIRTLAQQIKHRSISALFNEPQRAEQFSIQAADIFLDYAKQNLSLNERDALCDWAREVGLADNIEQMFAGEKINHTEQRAVLHTVLRAPECDKRAVLQEQAHEVLATEQRMQQIVDDVCSGKLTSVSGEKFTDVIAVGIGGSYYGIKVGLSALAPYHSTGLKVHVIANVDGMAVQEKLNLLSANTTLVVVISKTFTTQETILNANAIKAWMLKQTHQPDIIAKHWFAVSTNVTAATSFGLLPEHILPMWDWVGGRFSLWSAVGLPLALAIGNKHFTALKHGAYLMDKHFRDSPFEHNMPVIMALVGIWNRNGLDYSSLAILPYDHRLRALPGYLQQTDMESNGKSTTKSGEHAEWQTAPIVFGQEGTNGQHAFMQLMHQSDDIVPTDFIVAANSDSDYPEHHRILVANCLAQSEALMQGKSLAEAKQELVASGLSVSQAEALAPHKTMPGNNPSNTLLLNALTPQSFGALLALYEHKIFVQGVLWQVNSFDQWGVELGKQLGGQILAAMQGESLAQLSASSQNLIAKFTLAQFNK